MTPVLLGVIGLLLAHPVPALLARARWPYRAPRAGIVLWQSLALAAVLAVLGAGLSTALWLVTPQDPSVLRIAVHVAVLALTVLVGGRLAWSIVTVGRDVRARRRRHRDLVDLLARVDDDEPSLRILADELPMAYCLPGVGATRVVVSAGTLDRLDAAEVDAVLEHERAHVRARHDLVLEGFTALHRAFPRGPRGDAALHHSEVLVELLADDRARRRCGAVPLARALVTLGTGAATPQGALGAGSAVQVRLERLGDDPDEVRAGRLVSAVAAYAASAVVLVAPTLFLAVPWIASAWQRLA
ncbi:M56 family metallopeptidase [Solicola sp. PLA-1-18]|uniref:M56 family metallopeptidase n=1 Tax=Solicola sp. PLA-1-18 TaxID=3380532 RepID=UPI003B80B515